VEGLQARIRRDLENARWLHDQVSRKPDWELLAPLSLQTLCLRHVPASMKGDERSIAAHNTTLARTINEGGKAYLTPSVLKGKQILRVSIGAEGTERRHVEALWNALLKAANR
jgi:aromatic-L-amino-acid decarboxylase